MSHPCAAEVIESNYLAILSEAGGAFDMELLLDWVAKHKEGYFLRHEESPLDCLLFTPEQFFQLYTFERGDVGAMFRKVASTALPNTQGE